MSNDRLLIPQDPDCFHAIGLAAVAFARLEWDAVWCCQRLEDGYINTIEPRRKTAGKIAEDLERLFSRIADTDLRLKVVPFAAEFSAAVQERNGLLHGKPPERTSCAAHGPADLSGTPGPASCGLRPSASRCAAGRIRPARRNRHRTASDARGTGPIPSLYGAPCSRAGACRAGRRNAGTTVTHRANQERIRCTANMAFMPNIRYSAVIR